MSKQSFLDCKKPLLTAMIQKPDPDSCISAIRNAVYDGAEAFGFQICELKREYRDEETLRHIFSYCGSHPIYITNYRQRYSDKVSDEDRTEEMLTAMRAGAVLMDVMGDLYCPDPRQLTYDAEAVKKQKELIHEIHDMGGEVLMSAHIWKFVPGNEIVKMAQEMEARGADIAKIVTMANNMDELQSNIDTLFALRQKLSIPFVFLANGAYCKYQRIIAPMLGSWLVMCVSRYDSITTKEQPLLRNTKIAFDNIDVDPYRV
ncbi:MAG: type I 3-dehydroquinate dehydratase [Lachnospiraceae bacterium]|nr:type I 3-dehydroquinate dehydratase [Lachnospiraceae bacterium]